VAAGGTEEDIIEKIDIGGVSLIRAGAKNHAHTTIIAHKNEYSSFLKAFNEGDGSLSLAQRKSFAGRAFSVTAEYDGMIADWFAGNKTYSLRYGENPHQSAAFYRDQELRNGTLANYQQLQGKALSFNNIADADAAWSCVRSFSAPACVIVKHANPCGVAVAADGLTAYQKAFKTDPTSAFGGILAFNTALSGSAAQEISKQFAEVIIAPSFDPEALAIFSAKTNLRLLQVPLGADDAIALGRDIKRVSGGLLVQTPDRNTLTAKQLTVVTKTQPTASQLGDLLFAWKVSTWVKSNAIVFCANGMTLGVGAGQMSRIDSARIAAIKAQHAGLSLEGSAVASDAFFPFRDGLDAVADAGASCVIQPGGSMRDDEVIAAADDRGIAMVVTGMRHFRH
jgi:phosphoribosylaminoimidazolecarboxamide formyltransferase/IMP cyclohydrolase